VDEDKSYLPPDDEQDDEPMAEVEVPVSGEVLDDGDGGDGEEDSEEGDEAVQEETEVPRKDHYK
jgi:phage repressor protein C with HTH and peptisase S24 domain